MLSNAICSTIKCDPVKTEKSMKCETTLCEVTMYLTGQTKVLGLFNLIRN